MVDTHDNFNEVAVTVALYKMNLICVISVFGQYCQLNKHQFHCIIQPLTSFINSH